MIKKLFAVGAAVACAYLALSSSSDYKGPMAASCFRATIDNSPMSVNALAATILSGKPVSASSELASKVTNESEFDSWLVGCNDASGNNIYLEMDTPEFRPAYLFAPGNERVIRRERVQFVPAG